MSRPAFARLGVLIAVIGLTVVAVAGAVTVQKRGLRVSILSQIMPYKLPREKTAPIAVFVAGRLENAKGGIPPQLQRLTIDVNRHGLLQSRGLPVCSLPRIQPASSDRALTRCGDALIGSGRFWAHIVLPDQGAYPTQGRLLVFNGRRGNRPLLLAHIFTDVPFNTSFVIPFAIKRVSKGPYGTELSASLPEALGSWGYVDRIKLTLRRKYRYRGRQLSYFNAGCPAPPGATRTAFSLAKGTFSFASGPPIQVKVIKACGVKQ